MKPGITRTAVIASLALAGIIFTTAVSVYLRGTGSGLRPASHVLTREEVTAAVDLVPFIRHRDDIHFDIFTMNPDGSGLSRLTNTPDEELDPTWSTLTRQVAYSLFDAKTKTASIHVMNVDGSERKRLSAANRIAVAPAWSPDGRQIAFFEWQPVKSDEGRTTYYWRLYSMPAGGGAGRCLGEGGYPAWSPDGRRLLYSNLGSREDRGLFVMELDSGARLRLTGEADLFAQWSPDGKLIAFSRDAEIFVMNADGSAVRMLHRGVAPVWSIDGKSLFFSQVRGYREQDTAIWRLDLNGRQIYRLTDTGGYDLTGAISGLLAVGSALDSRQSRGLARGDALPSWSTETLNSALPRAERPRPPAHSAREQPHRLPGPG